MKKECAIDGCYDFVDIKNLKLSLCKKHHDIKNKDYIEKSVDKYATSKFKSDYGCKTTNQEIKNKLSMHPNMNPVTKWSYKEILIHRAHSVIEKQPFFNKTPVSRQASNAIRHEHIPVIGSAA